MHRTYDDLERDEQGLPIPKGVKLVHVQRSIEQNDADWFGPDRRVVYRTYTNSLPCQELESEWLAALRASHRTFSIQYFPGAYAEISISDRPEPIGIRLGDIAQQGVYRDCSKPLITAVTDTYDAH